MILSFKYTVPKQLTQGHDSGDISVTDPLLGMSQNKTTIYPSKIIGDNIYKLWLFITEWCTLM